MNWDYYKLPENKLAYVQQCIEENDEHALIRIHNIYKLSPHTYCCSGAGIINHFKHLLNERLDRKADRSNRNTKDPKETTADNKAQAY